VFSLRYKARRYDEVKDLLPALQAKTARHDQLKRLRASVLAPFGGGSRAAAGKREADDSDPNPPAR
jgi:hypothetical protein